ncbi:MAG: aminotransferase class III-fold pyridoxal phosphate-dependent enzyme [Actinobacteria bacterium]|nr:aminotransferase class III-fold pyridoxal phosphate-dependent enzyme [Actinomycetota bacterium]
MNIISKDETEEITKDVFNKYKDYYNPMLARLLKFSSYDRVEWKARGSVVTDLSGKKFIDCGGGYGVFNMGHSHPKIIQAVKDQLDLMPLSPRVFLSKPLADLAELLARITPGDLKYSFFCNSGTEAVEGAIKLARLSTKKTEIIAAINAFHGKTLGSLSFSGRDIYKTPFEPLVGDVKHVPFGDVDAIRNAITQKTAAVLLEPIQGEGGIIIPPDDYLPEVRRICDENNALLILDEIQTGMGRTGKNFACEHFGVVPDIMTLAKALGGGVMPIGAFIGTQKVWEAFAPNPLIHTSTFGGNPLACVAAKAALEVLIEEDLAVKSKELGDYLIGKLSDIKLKYPEYIADVRGIGLMIGVEFASEGIGGIVIPSMVKDGVTAIYTLNNPKVIRFEPPLVISKEQLDRVVDSFKKALDEVKTKYSHLFK